MTDKFFYDGDGQVLVLRNDGIWFYDYWEDTAVVLPYPEQVFWRKARAQPFAGQSWSDGFVLLDTERLRAWWTGPFLRRGDGNVDPGFTPHWHFLNLLEQRA